MNQPNGNILLSLVQGESGKEWAMVRTGWNETNHDGESLVPTALQYIMFVHLTITKDKHHSLTTHILYNQSMNQSY